MDVKTWLIYFEMESPFRIHQLTAGFNKHFGIDERTYCLLLDPKKLDCGPHLLDKLMAFERETRKMFKTALRRGFEGHADDDRACLVIYHPDLKEDIIVTLREIYTFTEDTILDHIDEEELDAKKPFKFKFTILCTCNE